MIQRLLALLVLLLLPAVAQATDAYVASTGSGSACTSVAPCGTILAASSVVTAGGTMYVAPGAYSIATFTTTMGGTNGNPITVICKAGPATTYVRGGCVFTPNAAAALSTFWQMNGGGYVVVDGLQLDGRGDDGTTWNYGIEAEPTAGYVTIQNSIFHHMAMVPTTICSNHGGAAIEIDDWHGRGIVGNVLNNFIHDIGPWQSTCREIHGLYLGMSGATSLIANNIIYNTSGHCLQQWDDGNNQTIINNTFVNCGYGAIMIGAAEWYLGQRFGGSNGGLGTANVHGGILTTSSTATSSNVLHFGASNVTPLTNLQTVLTEIAP